MELKYGRLYKTRDGRIIGPLKPSPYGVNWLTADGFEGDQWYSSLCKIDGVAGRCYYGHEDPLDLIEEFQDKPANRFYGEQRVEIKSGLYGVVNISRGPLEDDDKIWVGVPSYAYTPDELREAAHLFVQLAEYLENNH